MSYPTDDFEDAQDRADETAAVRKPVVEELAVPALAAGLQVFRMTEIDGDVSVALPYGFVAGQTDITVSALAPDLEVFVSSTTVSSGESE